LVDFYKEFRTTDDEFVKAAALAGAFENYAQKHPIPVHIPAAFRNLLPISVEEIAPGIVKARRRAGDRVHAVESIRACVDHEFEHCKHPHHRDFCSECPPRRGLAYRKFGVTAASVKFDPTFVTTVAVQSVFTRVSEKEANAIALMAYPPNWDDAAPTFFKEAVPVAPQRRSATYSPVSFPENPLNGHLKNGNGRASRHAMKYLLHERVEWAWSPILTGGLINVLEITMAKNGGNPKRFITRVLQELRGAKRAVPKYEPTPKDEVLIAYKYDLAECIQSKFVGGWESEGLDSDKGSYKAAWSPQHGGTGILVIEAEKTINYSSKAAAELFPGMSAVLNLLAPALTTMLMNHLTYYGPCSFLAISRELAKQKRGGRRGNSKRRKP
jgi:hypothetical protein